MVRRITTNIKMGFEIIAIILITVLAHIGLLLKDGDYRKSDTERKKELLQAEIERLYMRRSERGVEKATEDLIHVVMEIEMMKAAGISADMEERLDKKMEGLLEHISVEAHTEIKRVAKEAVLSAEKRHLDEVAEAMSGGK